MRGKTMGQLVEMLRAECRHSPVAAMGQNYLPTLRQLLIRTQESLWDDFAWPHMRIHRDKALQNGERYYAFDPDLAFDRVQDMGVTLQYAGQWRPVGFGIGPGDYNRSDSDAGVKCDPVEKWDVHEGNMYEVWPIPAADSTQVLRMTGIKRLAPFVGDDDRADLDDQLIVLFAAAEVLMAQKASDGQQKLTLAQRRYSALKGQQAKQGMFIMGGGSNPNERAPRRPAPLYGRKV